MLKKHLAKPIVFQFRFTNFINNTMFHSFMLTRSSVVIKICKIFFLNMKEDIRLNLKKNKNKTGIWKKNKNKTKFNIR